MDGSSPADALRCAVDGLLSAQLTGLSGLEVAALLEDLETQRRRLAAVDHRVVAEVRDRQLAGEFAATSTLDLLVQRLRITPAEARARIRAAESLGPRRAVSGEALPPLLPACADAVTAGEISAEHAAVIGRTMERIPAALSVEACGVAERVLVEAARHEHPRALDRTAAMLIERLDPDGREPREEQLERDRDVSMIRRPGRGARLAGQTTPECTAVWDAIFDSLAGPVPDPGTGERDPRTAGQRRHDALLEAGLRLLRSGSLPASGGAPVTVLVTVASTDLAGTDLATTEATCAAEPAHSGRAHSESARSVSTRRSAAQPDAATLDAGQPDARRPGAARSGTARTGRGEFWPVQRLRPLLGDATLIPILLDPNGAVLDLGRSRRLASPAQRLALAVRDSGCCFPGCTRPASWSEVHHVREWQDGGTTDLDNLCLLCPYHHRHFRSAGWHVVMIGGLPHWLAPDWLDPGRKPIRNTAHHPPEIAFRHVTVRAPETDDTG